MMIMITIMKASGKPGDEKKLYNVTHVEKEEKEKKHRKKKRNKRNRRDMKRT